jgi:VIT1/CCC1 family predicted Fe2+/Mn2+ transporter
MRHRRRSQPDPRRYQRYVEREFENVHLYRRLADGADKEHRDVLLELAAAEERHARYWQQKLADLGVATSDIDEHRPVRGTRMLSWLGRRLGVRMIVPMLERLEASERARYAREPEAGAIITADEAVHSQLVTGLSPAWRTRASGVLRAGVFGLNDGLVSNLALVAGMTGGDASRDVVILAGLAGLVAGAGSMAAGEYISVRSQHELLEGQRPPTEEELRALVSVGEVAPIELLMRLRGVDVNQASQFAERNDPRAVADVLAGPRPELTALGSPAGAALSSFVAFATGAAIPVVPFTATSGTAALLIACGLAGLALFAVGSTISLVTNRPLVRSGVRQLLIGTLTAGGTYLVGLSVGSVIG